MQGTMLRGFIQESGGLDRGTKILIVIGERSCSSTSSPLRASDTLLSIGTSGSGILCFLLIAILRGGYNIFLARGIDGCAMQPGGLGA